MKAKCGASIRVEVVDRATGQAASPEQLGEAGILLEARPSTPFHHYLTLLTRWFLKF